MKKIIIALVFLLPISVVVAQTDYEYATATELQDLRRPTSVNAKLPVT